MGRLSSNIGLITGTNISSTVDQLIKIAAVPRDRLTKQIESLKAEQVVVNELSALVIGVQLQTTRLGSASNLSTVNVSSSNEDLIKVTANSTAAEGTYRLQTISTAQASSQISGVFQNPNAQLSAGELTIRTGGFIDQSSKLEDLRGGNGIERGRIQITNRAGETRTIDLRFAVTTADVVDTINKSSGLRVTARLDGDRIVLSDVSGSTASNLIVEEVNGGQTASNLGLANVNTSSNQATGSNVAFLSSSSSVKLLLDGRGLDFSKGTDFSVTLADGSTRNINLSDTSEFSRLGQVIDAINQQGGGKVEAAIAEDGVSLKLIDKTTGSGTFTASGRLADSLGFAGTTAASGEIAGRRIQSTLSGPLLGSLNGGKGIQSLGTLTITNRNGVASNIDLSDAKSLDDVIRRINNGATGITASLNRSRTGIRIQDVSGGSASNLIVSDQGANQTATKLGIETNAATNNVEGKSLDMQFVSRQTRLSELNQGKGVSLGSFTITNSQGARSAINLLASGAKNVGDVIDTINGLNLNVEARLNDSGDGIYLIDNAGGPGQIVIAEGGSGSTAADLGILGTSTSKIVDGQSKKVIESNQNFSLTVTNTDTLSSVIEKVKSNSKSPINASLLSTSGGSVRLIVTSKTSGTAGRVLVDGDSVGISLTQSAVARDAAISVGASDEFGGTVITSASNDFKGILPGVDITVEGVSSETVTVTASKSNARIESNLKLFIDQYNKTVEKIKKETAYDANTQTSGFLFGSTEALRVEQALNRFITGRTFGNGKIQSLVQLGVSIGEDGKLSLDSSKLNRAIEDDATSVEKFFSDSTRGFGARGKALLENLVGVNNGLLINRSNSIQRQVETMDERVNALTLKLTRERTRLTRQFVGMEEAIAKIQSNLKSLDLSVFGSSSSS